MPDYLTEIKSGELRGVLAERTPKVLAAASFERAAVLPDTFTLQYGKVINLHVIPVSRLPLLLSGVNEALVPEGGEFSDILYRAAEVTIGETSYFSSYREKPALFKRLGGLITEFLSAGLDISLLKKLDNPRKWEEVAALAEKVRELHGEKGLIEPGEIFRRASAAAKLDNGITWLVEDLSYAPCEEELLKILNENNRVFLLPRPGGPEGVLEIARRRPSPVKLAAFCHPAEEASGILDLAIREGTSGRTAIGLAGYSARISGFRAEADRMGIEVTLGKGLPLVSFSPVRLFLSFLRLYQNEKRVRPLREIVSSFSLNIPDGVSRTYCRKVISDHKKNRTMEEFSTFIGLMLKQDDIKPYKLTSLEFLKKLSNDTAGFFGAVRDSVGYDPALFKKFIGKTIVGKSEEERKAVSCLNTLLDSIEGDRFFTDSPIPLEEKLCDRIKSAMTGGRAPDGKSLFIGTPEGVSVGAFERVFYAGFDQSAYSSDIPVDPVFPFSERDKLNRISGKVLVTGRRAYLENKRKEFVSLSGCCAREITFSWSANDRLTGKRVTASPYLFEVYRSLKGEPGDIGDLENCAGLVRTFPADRGFFPGASGILGYFKNLDAASESLACSGSGDVTAFTGRIDDGRISEVIGSSVFSPSQISGIIKCPARHLYEKVLRLKKEDFSRLEPFGWLDNLQWGTLVHETLNLYCRGIRDENAPDTSAALVETGEKRLKEYALECAPPNSYVYEAARSQLKNLLVHYHSHGSASPADFVPSFFEAGIGKSDPVTDPKLVSDIPPDLSFGLVKIKIRGIIDRIDADGRGNYMLLDYKTGKYYVDDKDPFTARSYVQHVLYPLMFRKSCAGMFDISDISSAYYFCTHRGGFRIKSYSGKELEEETRFFDELLSGLFGMIKGGVFPQNEKSCSYCDFSGLCPKIALREASGETLRYRNLVAGTENK